MQKNLNSRNQNIQDVKLRLAGLFPILGAIKRRLDAWNDSRKKTRNSYSQFGEDELFVDLFSDMDLSRSIYIDVGANHPTVISNTYLLYRMGLRGIVIEPNMEYAKLFERYRPGDLYIGTGCGKKIEIKPFIGYSVPVCNTFREEEDAAGRPVGSKKMYTKYIPVFPLDWILDNLKLDFDWICLMSIDTEGLDMDVLEGARNTLNKVYLLCVESSVPGDEEVMRRFLVDFGFEMITKMGCNLIFLNRKFGSPHKKTDA